MENDQPELSPSVKLGLWGGAWALSALCLLPGILFFPLFPAGLLQSLGWSQTRGRLDEAVGGAAFAVIALGVAGVS